MQPVLVLLIVSFAANVTSAQSSPPPELPSRIDSVNARLVREPKKKEPQAIRVSVSPKGARKAKAFVVAPPVSADTITIAPISKPIVRPKKP